MNGEFTISFWDKDSRTFKQIETAKAGSLHLDPAIAKDIESSFDKMKFTYTVKPTQKECRHIRAMKKDLPHKPRLPRKMKKRLKKQRQALENVAKMAVALATVLSALNVSIASMRNYPPGGYVVEK